MSYSRYLTVVNTALKDVVLPEVLSGRAKDAINNSIAALAGLAANLERMSPELLAAIDATALPPELKALKPVPAAPVAGIDPGIHLPMSNPAEDFSQNGEAMPLLRAGVAWLATQPWPNDVALKKSAKALLAWETAMRHDAMARANLSAQGIKAANNGNAVPDVDAPMIERYLRKRYKSEAIRVTDFKFLAGGRNRQTAMFTVEGTNDVPSKLVVQRDPPAALNSLTGLGMQFAVLQLAHEGSMSVARPVLVEHDRDALGAPFLITEQVRGESPVPSMDYWSAPVKSDKLCASLASQFALMHSLPITKMEGVMVRYVDTAKGQTWIGDINELEQQWQGASHAPSMGVTAALAWLRAHVGCVDGTETIVHNDALFHNCLAENEELTAVLDWEMAHIGHPFEDLGYVRPVVEQMTEWPKFVEAYVAAGGRRPTPEQVDFFTLRSILKLLILVMYARNAFDGGVTSELNMAEVGASFLPKLIERITSQLNGILAKE